MRASERARRGSAETAETLEEETLDDPVPIRNVRRPEGRRGQLILRYRESAIDEAVEVRLYGGWLR